VKDPALCAPYRVSKTWPSPPRPAENKRFGDSASKSRTSGGSALVADDISAGDLDGRTRSGREVVGGFRVLEVKNVLLTLRKPATVTYGFAATQQKNLKSTFRSCGKPSYLHASDLRNRSRNISA
jgi:hypothetical protein